MRTDPLPASGGRTTGHAAGTHPPARSRGFTQGGLASPDVRPLEAPRRFVFALVDDFTHIAFACAVEPLRLANLVSGRQLYAWSFASADGERATSSNGIVTLVHHGFDDVPACDRLFVLSGIDMRHKDTDRLIAALRRERARGVRIGALCSGAHILAKAGLLDGMQAAIHWEYHDSFQQEFPAVELVRGVFIADEKCITASGGTATADLMLHLIERDHGHDLSIAVADQMVYDAARPAGSAQRFSPNERGGIPSRPLIEAIGMMREHIEEPPTSAQIARRIGVSPRQMQRLFERYLNTTPGKYFLGLRLERARHLLLQTETTITEIAFACGFGSLNHFSRLYKCAYGASPLTQRRSRIGPDARRAARLSQNMGISVA